MLHRRCATWGFGILPLVYFLFSRVCDVPTATAEVTLGTPRKPNHSGRVRRVSVEVLHVLLAHAIFACQTTVLTGFLNEIH